MTLSIKQGAAAPPHPLKNVFASVPCDLSWYADSLWNDKLCIWGISVVRGSVLVFYGKVCMNVCVCACMCVRACMCVCVWERKRKCVGLCVTLYTSTSIHNPPPPPTHTHTHTQTHHLETDLCVILHKHIHKQAHTHTHTPLNTDQNIKKSFFFFITFSHIQKYLNTSNGILTSNTPPQNP